MRKCGFHSQSVSNELRDAIHAVRPTICVSLAHEASFWDEFASWIYLVGRLYEGDGFDFRNVNPERWAESCAALNMPYDAFTTPNEPATNEISSEDAKRLDDWCCRFRHRLLELGYDAAGPNVAAGTWHGDAIIRHMPNWCQEATLITLHSYSARAMWDQNPKLERPLPEVPKDEGNRIGWWYIGRYRGWKRAICDKYPQREGKFKMALTEAGVAYGVIDGALGYTKYGDVGWMTDLTEGGYLEGLRWATEFWNQDDYLLGAAIFMVGVGDGRWASFETLPLYPVLATFPEAGEVEPPPEPEPEPQPEPNGGSEVDIKVVDMEYNEQSFEWAQKKYGVEFRRAKVGKGQMVYRLTELWEKTGNSSLITQVLNEQGQPIENIDIAFYWPDAPKPPDPPTEVYSHDWYENFVHGPTNANGEVGPGMGRGAYHGPGEGGPHAVWIRDPNIPSDICEKLGMLGMTPHDHLDQKFQLMVVGEDGSEEPTNGGEGRMFVEISKTHVDDQSKKNSVTIKNKVGGGKFYDTRLSICIKNVEEDFYPEPFTPEGGLDTYYIELPYRPGDDEESRTFILEILDWREAYKEQVLYSDEFKFISNVNRQYTVLVQPEEDSNGGDDEEPDGNGEEPEPTGDGYLKRIAKALEGIEAKL